jgi:hypothetical protein
VVGAEGGSADLKGALMLGSGTGQIPKLHHDDTEFIAPVAYGHVVGAVGLLLDSQCPGE